MNKTQTRRSRRRPPVVIPAFLVRGLGKQRCAEVAREIMTELAALDLRHIAQDTITSCLEGELDALEIAALEGSQKAAA